MPAHRTCDSGEHLVEAGRIDAWRVPGEVGLICADQPVLPALHNAEAIFSNTTKHATIGPLSGFCARKIIDMAAAIVGGHD